MTILNFYSIILTFVKYSISLQCNKENSVWLVVNGLEWHNPHHSVLKKLVRKKLANKLFGIRHWYLLYTEPCLEKARRFLTAEIIGHCYSHLHIPQCEFKIHHSLGKSTILKSSLRNVFNQLYAICFNFWQLLHANAEMSNTDQFLIQQPSVLIGVFVICNLKKIVIRIKTLLFQ